MKKCVKLVQEHGLHGLLCTRHATCKCPVETGNYLSTVLFVRDENECSGLVRPIFKELPDVPKASYCSIGNIPGIQMNGYMCSRRF